MKYLDWKTTTKNTSSTLNLTSVCPYHFLPKTVLAPSLRKQYSTNYMSCGFRWYITPYLVPKGPMAFFDVFVVTSCGRPVPSLVLFDSWKTFLVWTRNFEMWRHASHMKIGMFEPDSCNAISYMIAVVENSRGCNTRFVTFWKTRDKGAILTIQTRTWAVSFSGVKMGLPLHSMVWASN